MKFVLYEKPHFDSIILCIRREIVTLIYIMYKVGSWKADGNTSKFLSINGGKPSFKNTYQS